MGDKKTVLIFEDSEMFAELLRSAMEEEFEVVVCADGEEGLRKAAELRPNIIVTDIMMPNMSGFGAIKLLLKEEATKDIPVIILSGTHFAPSSEQMFKATPNVKGFLGKTAPIEQIVGLVKQHIS